MFCFSCNDPKKVSLAKATVNSVEKLTADLQYTARSVSEMALRGRRTLEQSLSYMGVVERMNMLQREWATKVEKIQHCYSGYGQTGELAPKEFQIVVVQ